MPSLKKRIADAQAKMRKRQRKKEEKEISKLQKQRNKALRDAKRSLALAKAREDAKDAALKKSQAKARLNATKNRRGKVLLGQLSKGGKRLLRDLRGRYEQKPARRKKATKRRSTK